MEVESPEKELIKRKRSLGRSDYFQGWKRCLDPHCRSESFKATLVFLAILYKQSLSSNKLKRRQFVRSVFSNPEFPQ
jgi:hypothetical protein